MRDAVRQRLEDAEIVAAFERGPVAFVYCDRKWLDADRAHIAQLPGFHDARIYWLVDGAALDGLRLDTIIVRDARWPQQGCPLAWLHTLITRFDRLDRAWLHYHSLNL
jgi:hypothetical protein